MKKSTEDRIRQLQAEIDRLQAEPKTSPVWEPELGDLYYVSNVDTVSKFVWRDYQIDEYYLKMGLLFKTEQQAEDYAVDLKLVETIRRERFEAQGNWWPSEGEARYGVCWNQDENQVHIKDLSWELPSDVFGIWKDPSALRDVIEKHDSELGWYFTDYLPSIN